MAANPTLEQVLANVRAGNVVRLVLTKEQKRALKDADGRVALDVLRHLLGARPANPERFPLTEGVFQAVALKLGYSWGFGDLLGLPPPYLPNRPARAMRSLDEVFQGPR
jgi:hypothetical protein